MHFPGQFPIPDESVTIAELLKSKGYATGAMGKFKAGSNAALSAVKANAGNFAMAAGAALVGFAVKSVGAFQDLALASGKFADATGLSVEEASRFIEVGGDIGVSIVIGELV